MAGRRRGEVPASLVRGQKRLEAWRRTRTAGGRIPEKLWTLAVKLAEAHGVSRTATLLKLDYDSLKERVERKHSDSAPAPGTFVEFCPPSPTVAGECVIEFEDGLGANLRVHLRGYDAPDVVALGRMFRGVE